MTLLDKNIKFNAMLEDTLYQNHHVWIITDWHLVQYNKKTGEIKKVNDFDKVIETAKQTIGDNDMLICLGDIVDSEIHDTTLIQNIIRQLPGRYKAMTIGNNDAFSPKTYEALGFDNVAYGFLWRDVAFTHVPIPNRFRYNIHGHLHVGHPDWSISLYWMQYGITPWNHINAYTPNRRPVDLADLLIYGPNYETEKPTDAIPAPKPIVSDLLRKTQQNLYHLQHTTIFAPAAAYES